MQGYDRTYALRDSDEVQPSDSVLHSEISLRCPRCSAHANNLLCHICGFEMSFRNGVVHAIPPERSARYVQFTRDYECIRAAEGRGSPDDNYYLELPYRDETGTNSKQWQIRARSYEHLANHVLMPLGHGAVILDLGAGNCWMSYRLALAGYRPVAVDLLTNELDGLGAARHYDMHLSRPFARFQAELERLPFDDAQFDAVIFNAAFHYSEDYEATLREAFRCLKREGLAIVCDTPWYSTEESGRRMVAERRSAFLARYGTASDSIRNLEFLTDERLRILEERLSIRWMVHFPRYGLKWALRPWIAKFRSRREPSRFRIYSASKNA